jgi:hypothetical protein
MKITYCPPRKAKGSSIQRKPKRAKGQVGARFLARDSGQIEKK